MRGASYNSIPVIIDDIHYQSMFQASIETGLSYKTVWFKIAERNGAPVSSRGFKLCSEKWWKDHQQEWEEFLKKGENNGHKRRHHRRQNNKEC